MPPRWLRSRPERPSWLAVRERFAALAPEHFAPTRFEIGGPLDQPSIAWLDGPGPDRVAEALGDLPGWTLIAGPSGGDIGGDELVLALDRRLSDAALAIAVVRFYASQGRHWHSRARPADQGIWRALTGIDDPAKSGYPIPDAIARMLLEAPDPVALPDGPTRADVLASKLAIVGYDKLWAVAFAEAP
ncbi:MAG: hypothetical protein ACHQNA_11980 [Acidimicrobiales bacterium]